MSGEDSGDGNTTNAFLVRTVGWVKLDADADADGIGVEVSGIVSYEGG